VENTRFGLGTGGKGFSLEPLSVGGALREEEKKGPHSGLGQYDGSEKMFFTVGVQNIFVRVERVARRKKAYVRNFFYGGGLKKEWTGVMQQSVHIQSGTRWYITTPSGAASNEGRGICEEERWIGIRCAVLESKYETGKVWEWKGHEKGWRKRKDPKARVR